MEFLMKCLILFQEQVSAGRGNCSFDEQNSCCFFPLFFFPKLAFLISLQQVFGTLKGDFAVQHFQLKTHLSLSFKPWKNESGRALWSSFSCVTAHCLQDLAVQSIFELENKAESSKSAAPWQGFGSREGLTGVFLDLCMPLQQERRKFRSQGMRYMDEEGERNEWCNGKV